MTAKTTTTKRPRARTTTRGEVMAAVNLRLPRTMFDWLNDQAVEHGTTVSEEVRNAIASQMTGVPIRHVDEEQDES